MVAGVVLKEKPVKVAVRAKLIRIELAPDFDRAVNLVLDRSGVGGFDDHCAGSSAPFAHSENRSLPDRADSMDAICPLRFCSISTRSAAILCSNCEVCRRISSTVCSNTI